jgi:hypothetical protein
MLLMMINEIPTYLTNFEEKKDFICFQKVTLAVSKVRHLPHLPPLRYGHEIKSSTWGFHLSSLTTSILIPVVFPRDQLNRIRHYDFHKTASVTY